MPTYTCRRTPIVPSLDDKGLEAWQRADWTADFDDIENREHSDRPKPTYRTRAKMLWDDNAFYVLAEMEEPHVWGTLNKRNSIIYNDNDFEVFLDPDGDRLAYYEFEMNALGTIMELKMDKPYSDGGNYTFIETGVKSSVKIHGTLNNPADQDDGWTVQIAFPFADLATAAKGVQTPPAAGDSWRVNFSRVQWQHRIEDGKYVKVPKSEHPEDNWVWSPTGVIDMHRPEHWGVVTFAE